MIHSKLDQSIKTASHGILVDYQMNLVDYKQIKQFFLKKESRLSDFCLVLYMGMFTEAQYEVLCIIVD